MRSTHRLIAPRRFGAVPKITSEARNLIFVIRLFFLSSFTCRVDRLCPKLAKIPRKAVLVLMAASIPAVLIFASIDKAQDRIQNPTRAKDNTATTDFLTKSDLIQAIMINMPLLDDATIITDTRFTDSPLPPFVSAPVSTVSTATHAFLPAPPPPPPPVPSVIHAPPSPPPGLESTITALWKAFPGRTGIAIRRIDEPSSVADTQNDRARFGDYRQVSPDISPDGWHVSWRGDDLFPQQSVSKLWVAMAVLADVDAGRVQLDDQIRITHHDLTLFYQPLADVVRKKGAQLLSVDSLLKRAISYSDNTANDVLLRHIGGPEKVRAFLTRHQLGAIRFGPGERLLQAQIAGLRWHQSMSIDYSFQEARARLPRAKRHAAMRAYLADPVDGASPSAIARALEQLARGALLSAKSTDYLLTLLHKTKSGPRRLKAGFPSGWNFGHKTGTGQNLPPLTAGYNDIGIATAPNGVRYAVVVLLANTTARVSARMQLMQSVSTALTAAHSQQNSQQTLSSPTQNHTKIANQEDLRGQLRGPLRDPSQKIMHTHEP